MMAESQPMNMKLPDIGAGGSSAGPQSRSRSISRLYIAMKGAAMAPTVSLRPASPSDSGYTLEKRMEEMDAAAKCKPPSSKEAHDHSVDVASRSGGLPLHTRDFLDWVCGSIPSGCVARWRSEANVCKRTLTEFWRRPTLLCHLVNWWRSCSIKQKTKLLKTHIDLRRGEIVAALQFDAEEERLHVNDLEQFLDTTFQEHMKNILHENEQARGYMLVLHLIWLISTADKLSKPRESLRRDILTGIQGQARPSQDTKDRILVIRALCLYGVGAAVLKTFCEKMDMHMSEFLTESAKSDFELLFLRDITTDFAFDAVNFNYLDVLEFALFDESPRKCTSDIYESGLHVPVDVRNELGQTLPAYAASRTRKASLYFLTKRLPLPVLDISSTISGSSPLHIACCRGDLDSVTYLLNAGADCNQGNEQCAGATPLHWAVLYRRPLVVDALVEHGADTNAAMEYSHGSALTPLALSEVMEVADDSDDIAAAQIIHDILSSVMEPLSDTES